MNSLFLYVWYQPLELSYLLFQSFADWILRLFLHTVYIKSTTVIQKFLLPDCMMHGRRKTEVPQNCHSSLFPLLCFLTTLTIHNKIPIENLSYAVHKSTSTVCLKLWLKQLIRDLTFYILL